MIGERRLAEKIEWLFQNMWPPGLPEARNHAEAAAAIERRTGEDISATTVWKLRTGRADNPQLKTLTALARFFNVPIGYFGADDDSSAVADELVARALLDDPYVGGEALRALIGLPPETRELVTEFIRTAARLQAGRGTST